jgi:tetratricopeptide (TPR) repeat protein
LKRLGGRENLDRALIENAAASFHLENARHRRYLARVENNIANILIELERFDEALEHLIKARETFTELKDEGSVAQVNETVARVFLAQHRGAEAEEAAAEAVAILEQGDEHALLAEALTTQGIALAQLQRYQDAFEIFDRAAQIAELAGDRATSGRTKLVMIEQLDHYLAPEDLFSLYQEADECIGRAPDINTVELLRSAARIAVAAAQRAIGTTIEERLDKSSLKEEVRRYEGELIKRALERTDGQVTSAARMLKVTHQAFCEMLKTRHQNLRVRPPRVRQRS